MATVTVTPSALVLQVGGTGQLAAGLQDSAGNALSGRPVTWNSSATATASVSNSGLVTGRGSGTATISATSEGKMGAATATVITGGVASDEPVYSASNADHKLHVDETWASLTSIANLFTAPRSDGGGPWQHHAGSATSPSTYLSLVNEGDGFGSAKHVRIDFTSDPPRAPHGTGAHAAGFHWFLSGGTGLDADDNVRAEASNTVSAFTNTTLRDNTKNWPANRWVGHSIDVHAAPNLGGTRLAAATIVSNTANTLTVSGGWNIAGAASYVIGADGTTNSWIRGFDVGTFSRLPTRDAIVYEFSIRHTGTDWYAHGKLIDIGNASGGVGRFNYDPYAWNLGVGQPGNCDADTTFCSLFYSGGGGTSRHAGQPPAHNTWAPAFARSQTPNLSGAIGAGGVIIYKQNLGWGTGPGQFAQGGNAGSSDPRNADLSGTGKYMHQAGWLLTKIRITREPLTNPYVYGRGRIEVWIGKSRGALVKVMEYLGDVPGRPEYGKVWIDPTGSSGMPESVHIAAPTDRVYRGGAMVDVGSFRVWSHSRQ